MYLSLRDIIEKMGSLDMRGMGYGIRGTSDLSKGLVS